MKNLLPFLTRVPLKGDFEKAREELWSLPLLAIVTSFLPCSIIYFKVPLFNVLSLLALYWIIGLLHLDGLADFADGIMVKGDKERKIKALKDVNIGIAGVFVVVMVLLLQVYSLSIVPFYALFLAELNSKFAMLLALATRKPLGKGLGRYFMEKMNKKQLLVGAVIYVSLLLIVFFFDSTAFLSLLAIPFVLYLITLSLNNFGGLNGDCIGAIAELTRTFTLLVFALAGEII
jgi:adenosylcobinamide-GDP ribazoletransferase